jgi:regulator of RNase E activity RraA
VSTAPDRVAPDILNLARHVSTATLTSHLQKRGFSNAFMQGVFPLRPTLRLVGQAFTLRYIPAREDLDPAGETDNRTSKQRIAVESVGPGDVLVIDARGDVHAATLGDILAARIKWRGGAGIVVDGALRDAAQIREMVGLPCWSRGVHGSGFTATLVCLDLGLPVRCFGVTVRPGDYILADDDGLVAIPAALATAVAADGGETELKETFIRGLVQQGVPIAECYPPTAAVLDQFHVWKRERSG